MKRNMFYLCISIALLFLTACASTPEPTETPEPEVTTDAVTVPTIDGVWTGDWGPSESHRNQVTVELMWDGDVLKGIVNPGPDVVELQNTSFDPDTGAIHFEADVTNRRGDLIHYMIDGKLIEDTMSGSWSHDDQSGDFIITKN